MYNNIQPGWICYLYRLQSTLQWMLVGIMLMSCSEDKTDSEGITTESFEQTVKEATILLEASTSGSWPVGLDPATNPTSGLNFTVMNAVFGGLFQLVADVDGSNPRIVGILASDYEVSNEGRSLIIRLREGLKFSDGTPLDAEAVYFNIDRALNTSCSCAPLRFPWEEDRPVEILDDTTVVLNFSRPYPRAINAMPVTNINWVASPAALEKVGEEEFKIKPIGAGPFRIVSNQFSSKLVLEKNPEYWQSERPYLDRLTFQSVASNQAAYLALLAGDADAAEGITTPLLIEQAEANEAITVTRQPSTATYLAQLNSFVTPFDNELARQAIYYATDAESIVAGLFQGRHGPAQSFTGPGGLYHQEKIDGYRTYDLEKARAIVEELGGIQVTLGTIQAPVAEQLATTLQTQWGRAGIDVSIERLEIGTLVQQLQNRSWQALVQMVGSYDPEASNGIKMRFGSGEIYSGVSDEYLDNLLLEASSSEAPDQRWYLEAAQYMNEKAYAPFLFSFAPAQFSVNGIQGPGLTTRIPPIALNPAILWQDVRFDEPR